MRFILCLIVCLVLMAGTAVATYILTNMKRDSEMLRAAGSAVPLAVTVDLTKKNTCARLSPRITVGNVPSKAERLQVTVLDLHNYHNHHGGTVAPTGDGVIAEGTLLEYSGPCPPSGDHTYRFRVNALDKINAIIGVGEVALPCCSGVPE